MSAPTPNRRTVARFNIPQNVLRQPPWHFRRTAHELAAGGIRAAGVSGGVDPPSPLPTSENVVFLPGGAWALSGKTTDLLFEDFADAMVGSADMDLAPGVGTVKLFRNLSDLANLAANAGLIVSGAEAFLKRVAAGDLWDAAILAADAAAFLAPVIVGGMFPMDRVAAGLVNYDPNVGFTMVFAPPGGFWGSDAFLRFYFGGNTDVAPREATGGVFSLTLKGDGEALLEEQDSADPDNPAWRERMRFPWTSSDRAPETVHSIQIRPYGYDRIAFLTRAAGKTASSGGVYKSPIPISFIQPGSRGHAVYQDKQGDTGHEHLRRMTGSGSVRVDIARNYRQPWGLSRIKHPDGGTLVDEPFSVPASFPAGTPLRLHVDAFLLPNTGCSGALFDADTLLPLAADADGNFLTNAGQTTYFPIFTFTTLDRFTTPVLFGYTLDAQPTYLFTSPTVVTGGKLRSVTTTGPDLLPDHETAGLVISDLGDALSILRTRDRICSDVLVTDAGTGAIVSRLFSGITVDAPATYRGKPGHLFPNWRDYRHVRMLGPWALLAEKVPLGQMSFYLDETVPRDADGNQKTLPWPVSRIIRFLLNACGYPDSQISIPVYYDPIRLWNSPSLSTDTYLVQPGGTNTYTRVLQSLCHDYLGAVLCWDPNSGPIGPDGVCMGSWHVLPNPQPPYPAEIATFVALRSGAAHKSGTAPGTYGAGVTYIDEGSFEPWVRAPEVNRVYVCGVGQPGEDGEPKTQVNAELLNFASYDWAYPTITADPASPEYLGRPVSVEIYDSGLYGQPSVDFYCRRVYDRAATAQKWVRWTAPLLFVAPGGEGLVYSRPLRVNDIVRVAGFKAILRSCDINITRHDLMQSAVYSALFVE